MEVTKENLEIVKQFIHDLRNLMDSRLQTLYDHKIKAPSYHTGVIIDLENEDICSYDLNEDTMKWEEVSRFPVGHLNQVTFNTFLKTEVEKKLQEDIKLKERELAELKQLQEKYKETTQQSYTIRYH